MTLIRASAAAHELVRTALLAKLAVDLDDPALSRRAATEAAGHARLLAGLDFPASDDLQASQSQPATLGDLLARLYPPAAALEVDGLNDPNHDHDLDEVTS